jgi:cbb3-type cytochrome oxidase subunit 3
VAMMQKQTNQEGFVTMIIVIVIILAAIIYFAYTRVAKMQ